MKYFSTFSGIGGFELGIARASPSARCVGYSEIDPYALQIYQKHFNHKNYGDITKIKEKELPEFDILVGGFPCQSFSIAGHRKGFADTRGTLFFDIARIVKAKKPRALVLENVKGLLNHDNGQTIRVILKTLTDMGYLLEWQVLNSKHFGVPQNRERIFIVGHLGKNSRTKVFPFAESGEVPAQARNARKQESIAHCLGAARGGADANDTLKARADSGIDAKHPQTVIRVPEAVKKGYAEAREGQAVNLAVMGSSTRRGRVSDVAQTLDTGMQQYTPVMLARNQRSEIREMPISGSLSASRSAKQFSYLKEGYTLRRLTPVECERLQGFPDGWTEGISDTQRYKTLGNAVTVNVIQAIMERLL
jgi:DNA (cytosine-5)-methyltransferase 1